MLNYYFFLFTLRSLDLYDNLEIALLVKVFLEGLYLVRVTDVRETDRVYPKLLALVDIVPILGCNELIQVVVLVIVHIGVEIFIVVLVIELPGAFLVAAVLLFNLVDEDRLEWFHHAVAIDFADDHVVYFILFLVMEFFPERVGRDINLFVFCIHVYISIFADIVKILLVFIVRGGCLLCLELHLIPFFVVLLDLGVFFVGVREIFSVIADTLKVFE